MIYFNVMEFPDIEFVHCKIYRILALPRLTLIFVQTHYIGKILELEIRKNYMISNYKNLKFFIYFIYFYSIIIINSITEFVAYISNVFFI